MKQRNAKLPIEKFADLSGTTGRKREEVMTREEMRLQAVENYVKNATLIEALEELKEDTIDQIQEWLEELDGIELLDLISDINPDIHSMEDLDDEFRYMTVTEVLEELSDIDISDEYFDADNLCSFNDLLDYTDLTYDQLARQIFNGDLRAEADCYYCGRGVTSIMQDYDWFKEHIEERFKVYDKAKELFDMAMKQNPQEVLMMLWNMNM